MSTKEELDRQLEILKCDTEQELRDLRCEPEPKDPNKPTKHLKYLNYIIKHKWFVFMAGLKTKAPLWRLVIHDWSKLLPCEWFPYTEYFYGSWGDRTYEKPGDKLTCDKFNEAWLHHQHLNPHHWQYWRLQEDSGAIINLDMPDKYIREMVADWAGAGRAITGKWEVMEWYFNNRLKIKLSNKTECRVWELLRDNFSIKKLYAND